MWLPPLLLLALLPAAAVALQKINNPQQESFDVQNRKFHPDRRLSFVTKETGYIISRCSAQGSSDQLRSRPAVMTFRTERAAPSPDPVRSFRVLAANSTDLQISWDPPAAASDCLVVLLQLRDLTLQSDRQFNATCSPPAEGLRLRVHPHRRYRLLATVLSDFGQSRPAMLSLRTPSARPNRSPSNFTALRRPAHLAAAAAAGPTSRATALGEDADIGDDDDESIVDGAVYKVTVPGDQLTHRLAGLKPLRRYAAQVAARTVNGTGRFTRWLVFSTLPGAYRLRPARLRDQNTESQLHGDVPLPEKIRIRPKDVTAIGKRDSILLSWTRPSALVIPDKYVIYYGSQLPKERLAGEISGDQDAYQIRNLVPNQYYFITIVAIKDGVQAETPLHEKTQSGT
uniref:Fibronectin type-III domain-containing protein n=1 Tax=Macrostomum lignano TaxID=282301 RepID=A0A1I8F8L4_9PLAT